MTNATDLVARAADRIEYDKSRTFIRAAAAIALNGGIGMRAAQYAAEQRWLDAGTIARWIEKAAVAPGDTTTATWAVELVTPGGLEFVELVRPRTILGRLSALSRVPFNRGIALVTGGATYRWLAEGSPTPVGSLALSDASLSPTKAGGIVVLSKELLKLAAPGAEDVIRRELIAGLVAFSDTSFIDPTVAAVAGESPASITNGIAATASTGDPSEDLRALLGGFDTLDGVAVVASPLAAIAFATMVPGSIVGGLLFGFLPLIISSATGTNLVAIHMPSISYADDGEIAIDVAEQATLQMDTAPDDPTAATTVLVSLWQHNLAALKVLRFMNWARANDDAVAVVSGATYPAVP